MLASVQHLAMSSPSRDSAGQRGPSTWLAEADQSWGDLRHTLALQDASGAPTGRGLSQLVFDAV